MVTIQTCLTYICQSIYLFPKYIAFLNDKNIVIYNNFAFDYPGTSICNAAEHPVSKSSLKPYSSLQTENIPKIAL